MRTLKRILFIALSLVLLLIAVAIIWRKPLVKAVLPEIQKVKFDKVSILNDSASVDLYLAIHNKPYFKYRLKGIELEVFNDSLKLVSYSMDSVLTLGRYEKKIIPVHFKIPIMRIARHIRKLQGVDSTDVRVTGHAIITAYGKDYELPIEDKLTVRVPTPPEIEIKEIEYVGVEDSEFKFNITIDLSNRSDQLLELRGIEYFFQGEDMLESKGSYSKDIMVAPEETVSVTLPVIIEADKKLKIISKVLFNQDVIDYKFRLSGTIVKVAGLSQEIPVVYKKAGRVELVDKDRTMKTKITRRRDKN